jgi:beta-phosphoglucomutase
LKQNSESTLQSKVQSVLNKFKTKAVIFDLDGTLIDNNSYHRQTWEKYLEIGKQISEEEFNANMNGRTNEDAIKYIFGKEVTDEESLKHTLDKEALYREIYKPFIKPIPGLIDFLEILKSKNIPVAIATSGIQPNIDFMFENIPIKKYFDVVINSAHIKKGKPHPEIYLKAASLLNVEPANCLVFEDAAVGIKSAKAAGMKVIALATTQPKEELTEADEIVDDYKF